MSILDAFEPKRSKNTPAPTGDFVQVRVVPFQPSGTPFGYVFLGAEIGYLTYGGDQPRAGDLVTVIGRPGAQMAITRSRPPIRDPLFSGACKCKCRAASGLLFYVTKVRNATNVLVIDPALEAGSNIVKQYLLADVINAASIAVDPDTHVLYLMDNRTPFPNLLSDLQSVQFEDNKNYYTLLTYTLSGDEYVLASSNVLPGADFTTGNHVGPPETQDANTLSIVDGEVWIPRVSGGGYVGPGFFRWDGATFHELNLTSSDPLEFDVFGPITQVPDRPGPRAALYIGTNESKVIRFTTEGEVLEQLTVPRDPGTADVFNAVGLCNRLIAVQTGVTVSEA